MPSLDLKESNIVHLDLKNPIDELSCTHKLTLYTIRADWVFSGFSPRGTVGCTETLSIEVHRRKKGC